jgi:phage gp29-like protein
VTQEVLASRQWMGALNLSRGFGGTSDPTVIWSDMINHNQAAFTYYRELEEKDEDVGSILELLTLSITSRERSLMPADDSQQALDVANFIQEQLKNLPDFDQVIESLIDGAAYGVSILENIYEVSSGQVAIIDIKDRPQEMFTFGQRFQPQIGPLRFLRNFGVDDGELVPEQKFLVFSYRPRNGIRRGRPLLRAIFWPSWFKRQAVRFWLRFAEKGPGTAVVKYPSGGNEDEVQKALEAAENIIEKIAVAVPENFQMVEALLTAARSQDPAVYRELVERNEHAISRRIIGQTLTTYGSENGKGTQALGTVHQDTEHKKTCAVSKGIERVINQQLIRPLVLWNFGPNAPRPVWSINKENYEDLQGRSAIDDRLQKMGVPIPLSYARKKYSIPEPKAGDEILEPRQQTAPANAPQDPNANRSSEYSEEAQKNAAAIRELMSALKTSAKDAYAQRVKQLVAEIELNVGGAQ